MPDRHPLLEIEKIDTDIEPYLNRIGEIFRAFRFHDSGCTSLGVTVNGQPWFVKYSNIPRSITWLKQAVRFHSAVQHSALPRLRNSFDIPDGLALVYDWVEGECLRSILPPGHEPSPDELHPRDRFCALPADEIIAALDAIYDVHLAVVEQGFIAEDFYDGCMIFGLWTK